MFTSSLFSRILTLGLAGLLVLTACDSGGDNDGSDNVIDAGSASISFSGTTPPGASNFNGSALFATQVELASVDDEPAGFSLVLFNITESDTTVVGIGRDGGTDAPSTGTYDLVDYSSSVFGEDPAPDAYYGIFLYNPSSTLTIGASTSGTFTVDSVSDSEMTGSVDMSMVSIFSGTSFGVSASFTAERATQEQINRLEDALDGSVSAGTAAALRGQAGQ